MRPQRAGRILLSWPVDGDCSCQLPAVWSNCPCSTWILQVSLPAGSLFVQTVRSTCQADGAWGRTPFSAPLDKESCWQAAAERQRHVCPFLRHSRPWKNNTNKILEQQRGPSRNYWWCTEPHRALSFVAAQERTEHVGFLNKRSRVPRFNMQKRFFMHATQLLLV